MYSETLEIMRFETLKRHLKAYRHICKLSGEKQNENIVEKIKETANRMITIKYDNAYSYDDKMYILMYKDNFGNVTVNSQTHSQNNIFDMYNICDEKTFVYWKKLMIAKNFIVGVKKPVLHHLIVKPNETIKLNIADNFDFDNDVYNITVNGICEGKMIVEIENIYTTRFVDIRNKINYDDNTTEFRLNFPYDTKKQDFNLYIYHYPFNIIDDKIIEYMTLE